MNSVTSIADAGLYTDFNGLSRLKLKASEHSGSVESNQATKEVAQQFESLFLQMMLKSMREASQVDESADSEQTKFYMEMFDKQIALDLSTNGSGIGLAESLERDLSGGIKPLTTADVSTQTNQLKQEKAQQVLLRGQIERSSSIVYDDYKIERR